MKYILQLTIEPEKWTIEMFQQFQLAAIRAKEKKLEVDSKKQTEELIKKVKTIRE